VIDAGDFLPSRLAYLRFLPQRMIGKRAGLSHVHEVVALAREGSQAVAALTMAYRAGDPASGLAAVCVSHTASASVVHRR